MSHEAPMASGPAVKPALVMHAQRALSTILVAATLAACSPPSGPRPAPVPAPVRYTQPSPDLTLGYTSDRHSMAFFLPTCVRQNDLEHCLQIVFAIGAITERTPEDFATFLRATAHLLPNGYTGQWVLGLDSPGGSVVAALTLGRQIRTLGWNTVTGAPYPIAGTWVDAECASACVYVFAGGVKRAVGRDNALSVHQFADGGAAHMNIAGAQYLSGVIGLYLAQMGVSANLQTVAALTLPNQLTPLTVQDALTLGLATTRL